jgi:hypothetical protein
MVSGPGFEPRKQDTVCSHVPPYGPTFSAEKQPARRMKLTSTRKVEAVRFSETSTDLYPATRLHTTPLRADGLWGKDLQQSVRLPSSLVVGRLKAGLSTLHWRVAESLLNVRTIWTATNTAFQSLSIDAVTSKPAASSRTPDTH